MSNTLGVKMIAASELANGDAKQANSLDLEPFPHCVSSLSRPGLRSLDRRIS